MDRYLVLTTTTDQGRANRFCAALEDAGIPVMLEHVEIMNGRDRASGYRLLAPAHLTQTAMRLIQAAGRISLAQDDEAGTVISNHMLVLN